MGSPPVGPDDAVLVRVQPDRGVAEPAREVVEPIGEREEAIPRLGEWRRDPDQPAIAVQPVALGIDSGEVVPQLVRLRAGV
jgi:hypothetical protein